MRHVRLLNQRSELGLVAELGAQTHSYCSSHLDRNSGFSVLNSSCSTSTELIFTETDSEL
eukprot:565589-Pyramimonas_sp.AAC.1